MGATTIKRGNVWSSIEGPRVALDGMLAELEANYGNGAVFRKNGLFLSGLAKNIGNVMQVAVEDVSPPAALPGVMPDYLRPYQAAAVKAALEARNCVIKVPMGGGKTVITAGIAATVPCTWLYLVHRPNLAKQTAESLAKFLKEPVGLVASDVANYEGRVVCATFDSILRNEAGHKLLKNCEGLIVDEAHRAAANTPATCLINTHNAAYRIGLSATPFMRSDGKNMYIKALLGPQAYEIPVSELTEEKFLTPLEIAWVPLHHNVQDQGSWHDFYRSAIVNNIRRNHAIVELAKRANKPALVFVKSRAHGQALETKLKAELGDSKVTYVDGDASLNTREDICEGMRTGALDVVVSTAVFYEGVDVAQIADVIIGSGCASAIEAIQRIGRVVRVHASKKVCAVYDFADSGHRWLEKHTLARYQAYLNSGYQSDPPFPIAKTETVQTQQYSNQRSGSYGWLWWVALLVGFGILKVVSK